MSGLLEPIAEEQFNYAREAFLPKPVDRELIDQIYLLSIAVSMRRVADLLDRLTDHPQRDGLSINVRSA